MAAASDLTQILRSLHVRRRPGTFVFVTLPTPPMLQDGIEAVIREPEGFTVICTEETARQKGWASEFPAAWLTLEVHSSLAAVGLTAALAAALAAREIACNVVAGYYHDHLLVPWDRADDAAACLHALRTS